MCHQSESLAATTSSFVKWIICSMFSTRMLSVYAWLFPSFKFVTSWKNLYVGEFYILHLRVCLYIGFAFVCLSLECFSALIFGFIVSRRKALVFYTWSPGRLLAQWGVKQFISTFDDFEKSTLTYAVFRALSNGTIFMPCYLTKNVWKFEWNTKNAVFKWLRVFILAMR